MIANWSRLSQFQECRRKAYNWDELRLASWREADALLTGGGFHVGAAVLFAQKDEQKAIDACEEDMRKRYSTQMILPEEKPQIEHGIEWAKRAVAKFAEHYRGQDVTVLWPEVEFCVPMPNTEHHCFFMHRLVCPDIPNNEGCGNTTCWMPHYFKGKTDAVVQWLTKIWLFEHKTNSQAPEIFFKRYVLDAQATGYMYGIWRQLGVKPEGFILNVIQKPQKRAKDQLSVGFDRDYYLRSNEDLDRFALEFVEQANDYEAAFARAAAGNIASVYMNTKSCTNYNRQCYYMDYCARGFQANAGEFNDRALDYVQEEYYKLAGLEVPKSK